MLINTKNLVSLSEANRNFSKVARLVDETGAAIILKNNVPRYVILEYDQIAEEEQTMEENILEVANRKIGRHIAGFRKLVK